MKNNRILFIFPTFLALLAAVFWLMEAATEFEPAPALVAPVGAQDWNPTSTPTPSPTATPTPWYEAPPTPTMQVRWDGADATNKTIYLPYDPSKGHLLDYRDSYNGTFHAYKSQDYDKEHYWDGDSWEVNEWFPDYSWTNHGSVNNPATTAPGVYTITASFADDNSPPGGNDGSFTRTATVKLYRAQLKAIDILNEHDSFQASATPTWASSGTPFPQPNWVKDTLLNSPASQSRNTPIVLNVTVCIEPAGVNFELFGQGPTGCSFSETAVSEGFDQDVIVQSSSPLPNFVWVWYESIAWTITLTDPEDPIAVGCGSSGPHGIYVTYSTPLQSPTPLPSQTATEMRVAGTCWWVVYYKQWFADTEEEVADAIHSALAGDPPYDPDDPPPLTPTPYPMSQGWDLLDGGCYGACNQQAGLMGSCLAIQGIGGQLQLVRATSNAGAGNCLDQESDTRDGYDVWLVLDFDRGAGYFFNAFEGCWEAAAHYYAVWPSTKADDDYDMLKNKLNPQQWWVKTYYDIEPGHTGWLVQYVFDEQAIP